MKIFCKHHGVVEASPDRNFNVFCPECLSKELENRERAWNDSILRGLGVDPDFLRGPITYASSGISLSTLRPWQISQEEFVRAYLSEEMKKQRGKKRLRKKKAVRSLRQSWRFFQLGRLISRRVDYHAIGKKLFSVEPLPQGALPIYDRDPDLSGLFSPGREE